MQLRIIIAETPMEMEDRANKFLKELEENQDTVHNVQVGTAGSHKRFYSVITYMEDIS